MFFNKCKSLFAVAAFLGIITTGVNLEAGAERRQFIRESISYWSIWGDLETPLNHRYLRSVNEKDAQVQGIIDVIFANFIKIQDQFNTYGPAGSGEAFVNYANEIYANQLEYLRATQQTQPHFQEKAIKAMNKAARTFNTFIQDNFDASIITPAGTLDNTENLLLNYNGVLINLADAFYAAANVPSLENNQAAYLVTQTAFDAASDLGQNFGRILASTGGLQ